MSKFSKFSMSTFLGFNSSGFSTRALFSLLRRTRVTYYFFVLLARPCYVLLFCATGTPVLRITFLCYWHGTWGATPGPPGHLGATPGPPGHLGATPGPPGHLGATPGPPGHLGATPGPPGTWGATPGPPGHLGATPGPPGHLGGHKKGAGKLPAPTMAPTSPYLQDQPVKLAIALRSATPKGP
jgi:hypothetical protein